VISPLHGTPLVSVVMKQTPTVPLARETDEKAHSTSQNKLPQYLQQTDKGSPLVVLMILAGDIIAVAFVLLWLFGWR
jgi:hypothetical protein